MKASIHDQCVSSHVLRYAKTPDVEVGTNEVLKPTFALAIGLSVYRNFMKSLI